MPRFAAEDGVGLHYLDEGEGLPLLCLPGLSRNAADFDHVAPHLGGVRLIRPDYRGRGRSDRADLEAVCDVHAHALALAPTSCGAAAGAP